MVKSGVYTCELCDKQFTNRQSKFSHKQRKHPSGTIDNEDILTRMAVIRERISDLQTELAGLENKYLVMNNIDIDIDDDTSVTIAHHNPHHNPHEHAPVSPDIAAANRLSVEQLIRHWTQQ